MKIVHVMAWYIPLMGYQENFLPMEQLKLGNQVEIITSNRIPGYSGFSNQSESAFGNRFVRKGTFSENGITIHRLPCMEFAGQVYLFGLDARLRKIRPDIVQAHGAFSPSTLQTLLSSGLRGYKLFIDDHSHRANFHVDTIGRRCYIAFVKILYRIAIARVELFMPINNSAKQIITTRLEIPEERTVLFPLGADTSRFHKSNQLRECGRKDYEIRKDMLLIVTAGKFSEQKDISDLIRAFQLVAARHKNAALLLVGNGSVAYMNSLRLLANRNESDRRVMFHDFLRNSDLPTLYNSADIGVWPGDPSITAIEAIATGLPTIIPNDDPAYDMVIRENAAIGFERGNVDSLSKRIEELLDNPGLRCEIASNAEILARNSLAWGRIAEESLSIYRKFT